MVKCWFGNQKETIKLTLENKRDFLTVRDEKQSWKIKKAICKNIRRGTFEQVGELKLISRGKK